MLKFSGKSVYKGIAMGGVVVLKKNDSPVVRGRIEDPDAEMERVKTALEQAKEQLGKLYDKALKEVGEENAAIFEVHQMLIEDEDYLESIENTIRTEMVNAEFAVAVAGTILQRFLRGWKTNICRRVLQISRIFPTA